MYKGSRTLLSWLLKISFVHIEVQGVVNIPRSGSFILASNHISYLDPPVVGVACPRDLHFMARHDLFHVPLLSLWLRAVGVIPVKRDSADLYAIKQAIKLVKKGKVLALFPEGTRIHKDGSLGNPEPGIGFLASKLKVPVIPAFIKGTDKALPPGAKFIHPARVMVCFGRQIKIERGMPYQQIADFIMEQIRHLSC